MNPLSAHNALTERLSKERRGDPPVRLSRPDPAKPEARGAKVHRGSASEAEHVGCDAAVRDGMAHTRVFLKAHPPAEEPMREFRRRPFSLNSVVHEDCRKAPVPGNKINHGPIRQQQGPVALHKQDCKSDRPGRHSPPFG